MLHNLLLLLLLPLLPPLLRYSNPRISDSALYRLLPGPDFPTGGILVDPKEAAAAYKEGHGSLRLRARGHLESREPPRSPARGRRNNGHATNAQEERRIVVTELPYGVNKVGENEGDWGLVLGNIRERGSRRDVAKCR